MPKWFSVTDIAQLFLYVREVGDNSGLRVRGIQTWGGGMEHDSWCCWFATMILDIYFQGNAPIPRLGSCQAVYELAKAKGWITEVPTDGDLVLLINDEGHAHHIGIYIEPEKYISGNTNDDGSSNGYGVFINPIPANRKHVVFVRYPR